MSSEKIEFVHRTVAIIDGEQRTLVDASAYEETLALLFAERLDSAEEIKFLRERLQKARCELRYGIIRSGHTPCYSIATENFSAAMKAINEALGDE